MSDEQGHLSKGALGKMFALEHSYWVVQVLCNKAVTSVS
jgi:hypothetical protein